MSEAFTTDTGGSDEPDRGSILAPSPVLLALTFVFGVLLDRIKRVNALSRPWNAILGSLSFIAGTVLFVDAIRTMQRADTGPSHEDEAPRLITEGPFQYTRNPVYVGNCLQYIGLSLLYNSVSTLAVLTPMVVYLDRVIVREEAYLESRFGEEFETYRENVRRWL